MKANNGSGNIPERDEWETPKELWNKLDKQYHFIFDCCARYTNNKTDFYSYDFSRVIIKQTKAWMNPPFSKAEEMFKIFFKMVIGGIAIYRCDNLETKIWQDVIFPNCDWIFIPKGRVVYEGMIGSGSRFPSALIGVGVDPPKYVDGICLKLILKGSEKE